MSAGHKHSQPHDSATCREVQRLLKSPDIKAYLRRPFRTDYSHKIPLTGGSSLDGKVYYVDPDVPSQWRPYVLWHERTEKAFRSVKGMAYARAHTLATCAERMMVERNHDWSEYKKDIARPVRANEKRGAEKLPAGFDLGPYRESGLMKDVA